MVEVAEILRVHGPPVSSKVLRAKPRSHLRAMRGHRSNAARQCWADRGTCARSVTRDGGVITRARTGTVPSAGNDQAEKWLEEQTELLLPVVHFLVTFTLPEELRRMARSNQKTVYSILFRASSELKKLAWDDRFVGGRVGMSAAHLDACADLSSARSLHSHWRRVEREG